MGWSDLPSDLAISIAARLWESGDYLRFRAVCRSWKSAVRGFRPSFFPWLAVTHCAGDRRPNGLSFISHVANNHVYKGRVPSSSSIEYSGINKGGLMISVSQEDGVPIIFNPVTGAQLHHLPSLLTEDGVPISYDCDDSRRIGGIILADNLSAFTLHLTEEHLIISTEDGQCNYDDGHLILAVATPGDDTWSFINLSLPYDFNGFRDIVFHEADHKFYTVDCKGKLLSFCLTRCGGKTVVGEISTILKGREDRSSFVAAHLVSYGSNLLLVIGMPSWKEDFEIHKYSPDADTWIGMTNIDLGNNSLFIDDYGTKLLPLPPWGEEEERLRRNCIYFIHYEDISSPPDQLAKEDRERKYNYIAHVRIYDANKGIVEPCLSTSDCPLQSAHMWFTPSLSIND